MKLLCAVMIGTQCVAWHPKGTRKADIAGYGTAAVACEPGAEFGKCAIPERRVVMFLGWDSVFCGRNRLERLLLGKQLGTEASFSCTNKEWAEELERIRRANLSDIQRQHEDAEK